MVAGAGGGGGKKIYKVDLIVDASQIKTALAGVQQPISNLNKGIKDVGTSVNSIRGNLGSFGSMIKSAFGLFATQQLASLADGVYRADKRLQYSVKNAEDYATAQKSINTVVTETFSTFEDAASLYQRLSIALSDTGASAEETGILLESLNFAFRATGITGAELTSATRQLTQAMASNRLAGDELRSIMENAPTLAQLFAKEMGIAIGQLKQYGSEGKITGEVIRSALTKNVERFREENARMGVTFAESWASVKNTVAVVSNRLAEMFNLREGFGALSKAVRDNANAFALLIGTIGTLYTIKGAIALIGIAGAAFRSFSAEVLAAYELLKLINMAKAGGFFTAIAASVGVAVEALGRFIGSARLAQSALSVGGFILNIGLWGPWALAIAGVTAALWGLYRVWKAFSKEKGPELELRMESPAETQARLQKVFDEMSAKKSFVKYQLIPEDVREANKSIVQRMKQENPAQAMLISFNAMLKDQDRENRKAMQEQGVTVEDGISNIVDEYKKGEKQIKSISLAPKKTEALDAYGQVFTDSTTADIKKSKEALAAFNKEIESFQPVRARLLDVDQFEQDLNVVAQRYEEAGYESAAAFKDAILSTLQKQGTLIIPADLDKSKLEKSLKAIAPKEMISGITIPVNPEIKDPKKIINNLFKGITPTFKITKVKIPGAKAAIEKELNKQKIEVKPELVPPEEASTFFEDLFKSIEEGFFNAAKWVADWGARTIKVVSSITGVIAALFGGVLDTGRFNKWIDALKSTMKFSSITADWGKTLDTFFTYLKDKFSTFFKWMASTAWFSNLEEKWKELIDSFKKTDVTLKPEVETRADMKDLERKARENARAEMMFLGDLLKIDPKTMEEMLKKQSEQMVKTYVAETGGSYPKQELLPDAKLMIELLEEGRRIVYDATGEIAKEFEKLKDLKGLAKPFKTEKPATDCYGAKPEAVLPKGMYEIPSDITARLMKFYEARTKLINQARMGAMGEAQLNSELQELNVTFEDVTKTLREYDKVDTSFGTRTVETSKKLNQLNEDLTEYNLSVQQLKKGIPLPDPKRFEQLTKSLEKTLVPSDDAGKKFLATFDETIQKTAIATVKTFETTFKYLNKKLGAGELIDPNSIFKKMTQDQGVLKGAPKTSAFGYYIQQTTSDADRYRMAIQELLAGMNRDAAKVEMEKQKIFKKYIAGDISGKELEKQMQIVQKYTAEILKYQTVIRAQETESGKINYNSRAMVGVMESTKKAQLAIQELNADLMAGTKNWLEYSQGVSDARMEQLKFQEAALYYNIDDITPKEDASDVIKVFNTRVEALKAEQEQAKQMEAALKKLSEQRAAGDITKAQEAKAAQAVKESYGVQMSSLEEYAERTYAIRRKMQEEKFRRIPLEVAIEGIGSTVEDIYKVQKAARELSKIRQLRYEMIVGPKGYIEEQAKSMANAQEKLEQINKEGMGKFYDNLNKMGLALPTLPKGLYQERTKEIQKFAQETGKSVAEIEAELDKLRKQKIDAKGFIPDPRVPKIEGLDEAPPVPDLNEILEVIYKGKKAAHEAGRGVATEVATGIESGIPYIEASAKKVPDIFDDIFIFKKYEIPLKPNDVKAEINKVSKTVEAAVAATPPVQIPTKIESEKPKEEMKTTMQKLGEQAEEGIVIPVKLEVPKELTDPDKLKEATEQMDEDTRGRYIELAKKAAGGFNAPGLESIKDVEKMETIQQRTLDMVKLNDQFAIGELKVEGYKDAIVDLNMETASAFGNLTQVGFGIDKGIRDTINSTVTYATAAAETTRTFFSGMATMFNAYIKDGVGASMKAFLDTMLEKITDMIIQLTIMRPLMEGIEGIFSGAEGQAEKIKGLQATVEAGGAGAEDAQKELDKLTKGKGKPEDQEKGATKALEAANAMKAAAVEQLKASAAYALAGTTISPKMETAALALSNAAKELNAAAAKMASMPARGPTSAPEGGAPKAGGASFGGAAEAAGGALLGSLGSIFKFADGGIVTGPRLGIVGEAGPEAVIPLSKLGNFVKGEGGGEGVRPIVVTVFNNNAQENKVEVKQTTGASGEEIIEVMVEKKLSGMFTDGTMDQQMRANYGIIRQGY